MSPELVTIERSGKTPDGVAMPRHEMLPTALELAARYPVGPVVALAAATTAIDHGVGLGLEAGMSLERTPSVFCTADKRVGIQSFPDTGPGRAVFTTA